MHIHFECPYCRRRLKVAERHAGTHGPCPGCKHNLMVPFESDPRMLPAPTRPAVSPPIPAVPPAQPTMPIIRFPCPHCWAEIRAESHHVGDTGNCPGCGGAIVVPDPHVRQAGPPGAPGPAKAVQQWTPLQWGFGVGCGVIGGIAVAVTLAWLAIVFFCAGGFGLSRIFR